MNLKTPFTLFIVLSLVSFSVQAQTGTGREAERNLDAIGGGGLASMVVTFDDRYEGLQGNEFLYENWNYGKILLKGKATYENIQMKYDILSDEVVLLLPERTKPVYMDKRLVSSFSILFGGFTRKFISLGPDQIKGEMKIPLGYYEEIYGGKNKILLKHRKQIIEADYQGAYSSEQKADEIADKKPEIYLYKENQEFVKIKRKIQVIDQLLPEKNLTSYAKKNKLNVKNDADLIKILNYYEQ